MSDLGARLARMPSDQRRATLESLPTHLAKAANAERLYLLLMNFAFIAAKIFELKPQPLIEDYDFALVPDIELSEKKKSSLRLIQEAIRLSAHILDKDKKQLPGQLIGRLISFDTSEIQCFLEQIKLGKSIPWLRPLIPNLTPPNGTLLRTLTGHSKAVQAVALTPDGKCAVSASEDNTLKVWDWESGTEVHTLAGHLSGVLAVAVTPDGQWAVSASRDKTLRVWDLKNGIEIHTLTEHSAPVIAVAIIPNGQRAISASGDRTVKVWDLKNSLVIRTFTFYPIGRLAVAITPDGKYAISASEDNTLKVWDLGSGAEVHTLAGHRKLGMVQNRVTPLEGERGRGGEGETGRLGEGERGRHRTPGQSSKSSPD